MTLATTGQSLLRGVLLRPDCDGLGQIFDDSGVNIGVVKGRGSCKGTGWGWWPASNPRSEECNP